MANLLVVDDEQSICWGLVRLGEDMGHRVRIASSAEQALELVDAEKPDCIVLDVRLPGMDGLQAVHEFQRRCGKTPIIVITAYGDLNTAVSAVRKGAFDYIVKPFDLQKMQSAVVRALATAQIYEDRPGSDCVGELIGRSTAMQEVFKRIALAAASDISVLLCGESGTGKELAARAIHQHSDRADCPFVAVNVAALNPSLAESELFGHLRGAFTGAERDRTGLLAQANGGTLFLDEVADIPLATQVKLLRALDHREVLPLGGSTPIKTDFRVISASHQNLLVNVENGTFRHDLYFRLCAFEIVMPALRDRPDDVPLLVEHFLVTMMPSTSRSLVISSEGLLELARRPWFGNIRELRNAVEHAAMLARCGAIEPEHFPAPSAMIQSSSTNRSIDHSIEALVGRWVQGKLESNRDIQNLYQQLLELVEPPLLSTTLERHHNQCAPAARALGMHRTTLRKKLEEWDILSE